MSNFFKIIVEIIPKKPYKKVFFIGCDMKSSNLWVYPASFGSDPLFPKISDFEIHKTSKSKGLGVITKRAFAKGELVAKMAGPTVDTIQQHTLQIAKDVHLHDTYFSGYFLHSCDPNIHVDMQKLEVTALKPIKKNAYLYMDYSDTEDYLFKIFKCGCGAKTCRGIIRGKKDKNLAPAFLADQQSMLYKEKQWWEREDLTYKRDQLFFANRLVKDLAKQADMPTFFYSINRIEKNLTRLKDAFAKQGMSRRTNVFYAMKANRFIPILSWMASQRVCGIDACSPEEIEYAISCGFREEDISFTATSLSAKDFAILSKYPRIHINCDSIYTLKQCIKFGLTFSLGVRINPELGTSRTDNSRLKYAGEKQTKFGVYTTQLKEFITTAKKAGVEINTVHFHTGCGYLNDSLNNLAEVFKKANEFIQTIGTVKKVNIGGGLGVPHQKIDGSLDLFEWSKLIKNSFAKDLIIQVEPGEYIVKDSGILIVEKTFTERKKKKNYIGINAGFNIAIEPAFYGLPFEPVILERYHGKFMTYDVVGNINEALDVWYEDLVIEDLQMHKHLAIINAGGYSSSMASNHCMRGNFREVLLVN